MVALRGENRILAAFSRATRLEVSCKRGRGTSAATSRVGGGSRGVWPALRVLVDRSRAIFIALSVLFKLRLSGERMRAFVLQKTLRVG